MRRYIEVLCFAPLLFAWSAQAQQQPASAPLLLRIIQMTAERLTSNYQTVAEDSLYIVRKEDSGYHLSRTIPLPGSLEVENGVDSNIIITGSDTVIPFLRLIFIHSKNDRTGNYSEANAWFSCSATYQMKKGRTIYFSTGINRLSFADLNNIFGPYLESTSNKWVKTMLTYYYTFRNKKTGKAAIITVKSAFQADASYNNIVSVFIKTL